jgi:hypothetical protein
MGLYIALQKESGELVEGVADDKNLLHSLLPRDDGSLLSFIDLYGDTTFNGLQTKPFLIEWQELQKAARSEEEVTLLNDIQTLAARCRDGIHLYLKFVGD